MRSDMTADKRAVELDEIKLAYLEQLAQGTPPNLEELVARHPEYRTELLDFVLMAIEVAPEFDEPECEDIPADILAAGARGVQRALEHVAAEPIEHPAPAGPSSGFSKDDLAWVRALPIHEIVRRGNYMIRCS